MTIHLYSILIRLKNGIARRRKWLVVALIVAVFYWIPLGEYLLSVGRSVFDHGISSQTVKEIGWHNNWLKRYFTGPPSDDEMRAFFQKHRASFERMAYLFATEQCAYGYHPPSPVNACAPIEKQIGVGLVGIMDVGNSAFRPPLRVQCGAPCQIQLYRPYLRYQDWWRNSNPAIEAWSKEFIYIPPLLPASALGLKGDYPTDRNEAMRRFCRFPKKSLDLPVPEILAETLYSDDCGYFELGEGWYVIQTAAFRKP
jgi:hypothetical protein